MRSKHQPGPWRVIPAKSDDQGRGIGTVVVDAKGKKVSAHSKGNAPVVALAPTMQDLIRRAAGDLFLMVALIRGVNPDDRAPGWVAEMERLAFGRYYPTTR